MAAIGMKMKAGRAHRRSRSTSCRTTCSSSSPASSSSSTRTRSSSSPTKEDLARDRRKVLTAKIASGEWDGIIVTHSSFERIGMSREYQARFLREQIAEYDELLVDSGQELGPGPPEHHQDDREAEGPARGAAEGAARRGQEGRRARLRRAGRRLPLHRRGPLLQEPRDADQDGAGRRHPDRRQRAGVRPLHEGPLPGRAAPRARRHASPPARRSPTRWSRCTRCSGTSTPKGLRDRGIEHFDALGGDLRRGGRHDGDCPGRGVA